MAATAVATEAAATAMHGKTPAPAVHRDTSGVAAKTSDMRSNQPSVSCEGSRTAMKCPASV